MRQIIFDCDNTMGLPFKEIDDGLTLLYLLGQPDIRLLGVTTTFGNGTTDQAYRQTRELLRRVNRPDIPVWKGQAGAGEGFTNPAAGFLARSAADHPGEISVLSTGPATNLLAAFHTDRRFFENLRSVVCMGGYLGPLRLGRRSLAELNLSADPLAAHTVLNAPCPVTLMSAQLCLQASFGWGELRRIRPLDPWLHKTVRNWLLTFRLSFGVRRFYLWDLVPAVYLTHPELFDPRPVAVISTVEDLSRGKIVLDQDGHAAGRVNLPSRILDPARFMNLLFDGWSKTFGSIS